jgi:hypothetical protein
VDYLVSGLRAKDRAGYGGKSGFSSFDGKVTSAQPAFKWAVGKPVGNVVDWCKEKGMTIRVRASSHDRWRKIHGSELG